MPERTHVDDPTDAPHAELFDARDPRVVRLRLDAGESVPEHRHPDSNVVLHAVDGAIELSLDDETYDLRPGDVVRFDGDTEVSPRAEEPSTALVVFAPKEDGE
jgi:quercetin dioxygenase-like cupin family protein